MSQHTSILKNKNRFLYGFDAPTGGFFYSELDNHGDEVTCEDGLTLTELLEKCKNFGVFVQASEMIDDYFTSDHPSNLQQNIAILFGKRLNEMLNRVDQDIKGYRY